MNNVPPTATPIAGPDVPRAYEGALAAVCGGSFTTQLPALTVGGAGGGGRYAWGAPLVGNANTIQALGGALAVGPAT